MGIGMGSGSTGIPIAILAPRLRTPATPAPAPTQRASTWEGRLYSGLRVGRVPPETRAALTSALGELGVEAEYFVALVSGFPGAPPHPHERGQAFLLQLEAACHRLISVSSTLEIATQSYLSALEAGFPELRGDQDGDSWWPPFPGYALPGEPLELRLRRCGYAYLHVVT
ncbi:MAG: hypothetical protein ACRDHP_00625, partial [Ktedonobacterales bacterium]